MRYHDIKHDDMLNGDGLRVVLFVAGCSHNCEGCQNPQTHDPNGGILFDDAARQEIFEQLEQSYISGLTLCGGDPLFYSNIREVTNLTKECREKYPNKSVWMYTGDLWEDVKNYEIMKYLEVVIDGPFIESLKSEKHHWGGSTNQRVINVQESIKTGEVKLWEEDNLILEDKVDYAYDENSGRCISCSA